MTTSHTNARSPFERLYTYRDQPWRSLYTTYQIALTIFLRLPYWILIGLFPWGRLHPQFTFRKALIIRITRTILSVVYRYVTRIRSLGLCSETRPRLQNHKVLETTPQLCGNHARSQRQRGLDPATP